MRKRRVKRALKVTAKAAPSRFRAALAADGAILFLGAKGGDFEIRPEDVRAVLSLSRRLTSAELAETIKFVQRLDKAEVAA